MLRLNRVKGPSCLNKRAEGHIDNCNKDIAIMTAARTLWTIADVFIAMSFSCSVLDKCFVAGQQFVGRRGIFSFVLLIEAKCLFFLIWDRILNIFTVRDSYIIFLKKLGFEF